MTFATQLRQLLAEDNIADAITLLRQHAESSDDKGLLNTVVQLSGRFNAARKAELQGTAETGQTRLQYNQIRTALSELIDHLDPALPQLPYTPSSTPQPAGRRGTAFPALPQSKIPLFTGAGALLIAIALMLFIGGCPTAPEFFIIRAVLALGIAGLAYYFTGFIEINLAAGVKAGGALGVFALVFFLNPAGGIVGRNCITQVPVTVFVHGKGGKQDLVLRQQGHVLMDVGGERKRMDIGANGQAFFNNLQVGDSVRLEVDFSEPYKNTRPDSVYRIDKSGNIYLEVALPLDRIYGQVIFGNGPVPGVIVSINASLRDTTDDLGNYELNIPEPMQKKEQRVTFFKPGFKMQVKPAFPQTGEALSVVMEK